MFLILGAIAFLPRLLSRALAFRLENDHHFVAVLWQRGKHQAASRMAEWLAYRSLFPHQRLYWTWYAASLFTHLQESSRTRKFSERGLRLTSSLLDRPQHRVFHGEFLKLLGQSAFDEGCYEEAFRAFRDALGIDHDMGRNVGESLLGCSAALYKMRLFEDALNCALQAEQAGHEGFPDHRVLSHCYAAYSLEQMARSEEARVETMSAFRLSADASLEIATLYHVADLVVRHGDAAQAREAQEYLRRQAGENYYAQCVWDEQTPVV